MGTSKAPESSHVGIYTMLERRYEAAQGWLLFYEVANATGFKGTGYADALAMSVWPGRGIALHGLELKRSRSDLVKELRDPDKSLKFQKFCNHWWLLVDDVKLVEGVEVPATWGILAPKAGVLRQVRAAPKLKPEPWTPDFVAAMMRRFHESYMAKDMAKLAADVEERAKALMAKKVGDVSALDTKRLERERDHFKDRLEQLQATVDRFQADSGLVVNNYGGGAVGDAVRVIHNAHDRHLLATQLAHSQSSAERIVKSIGAAVKCLEQLSRSSSTPAGAGSQR